MKSALAIGFGVALFLAALGIVGFNIHSLTTPLLVAAGASAALGMALVIPADFKQAVGVVKDNVPDGLFGRRKYDPPASPPLYENKP